MYRLPNDLEIHILSAVYFVATKLVALRDRGWVDLRLNQDLEDVVHVVDSRKELAVELAAAPADVRRDNQQRLLELLAYPDLLEAVEWTLVAGSSYERMHEVERRLQHLADA